MDLRIDWFCESILRLVAGNCHCGDVLPAPEIIGTANQGRFSKTGKSAGKIDLKSQTTRVTVSPPACLTQRILDQIPFP